MTDLTALIERVRTGTGEDRELECLIWDALGFEVHVFDVGDGDPSFWREWASGERVTNYAFTTSLDAVVRLVEEKLPGWWWNLSMNGGATGTGKSFFHARLMPADVKDMAWGMAQTPARALLAALLLALQAQEAEG